MIELVAGVLAYVYYQKVGDHLCAVSENKVTLSP